MNTSYDSKRLVYKYKNKFIINQWCDQGFCLEGYSNIIIHLKFRQMNISNALYKFYGEYLKYKNQHKEKHIQHKKSGPSQSQDSVELSKHDIQNMTMMTW